MRARYLGTLAASAAALIGVAAALPAAAAATGAVVFTNPSGSVSSIDSIDVALTLTLDQSSSSITTDAAGNITSGVTAADLIAAGIDPTMVASSDINASFSCSGTFTTVCSGPPYNFDFAFPPQGLPFADNLDLEPGSVTQVDFGTFVPSNGPVPYGTYTFYDASIFAQFYDASGNHLGDVAFFDTCQSQQASCAFTRTVDSGPIAQAGVPEPAAWALMIGGFGLAGASLRRRRVAAA